MLALDLSLTRIGWASHEAGSGTREPPGAGVDRLDAIVRCLGELLRDMPKATGGTHGGRPSKLGAKPEPSSEGRATRYLCGTA